MYDEEEQPVVVITPLEVLLLLSPPPDDPPSKGSNSGFLEDMDPPSKDYQKEAHHQKVYPIQYHLEVLWMSKYSGHTCAWVVLHICQLLSFYLHWPFP